MQSILAYIIIFNSEMYIPLLYRIRGESPRIQSFSNKHYLKS